MKPGYDKVRRAQIEYMKHKGYSVREIAKQFRVSIAAIYKQISRYRFYDKGIKPK